MTSKTTVPAVLVCCGSFNPITNAHIDMIKTARRSLESSTFPDGKSRKVIHAFVSPVNDAYKKPGLAPFPLRREMCEAAFKSAANSWITVHAWEGQQEQFVPTYIAMKKIFDDLKRSTAASDHDDGGGEVGSLEQYLVCGGDLLESFWKPGAWGLANLEKLLKEFKFIVMSREGSVDPKQLIESSAVISNEEKFPGVLIDVKKYLDHFQFAALEPNQTSSTMVRTVLKEKGIDGLKELNIVPEETLEVLKNQTFYTVA